MKKLLFFWMLIFACGMKGVYAQQDTLMTPSGLKYIILKQGDGAQVYANRQVTVTYIGYLEDGTVFDQSESDFSFVTGRSEVIRGWEEGVRLMKVGSVYRFIIPPHLAYGKKGYGSIIPPNATLIFNIRILSVNSI